MRLFYNYLCSLLIAFHVTEPHATQCCTDDGQLLDADTLHDQCYPIIIPYNDPVYSKANIRCLNFVRSTTDLDRGCTPQYKPAEQVCYTWHLMVLFIHLLPHPRTPWTNVEERTVVSACENVEGRDCAQIQYESIIIIYIQPDMSIIPSIELVLRF